MKIHRDLRQKTWPWFQARAGKVSGSELGNLITDKGKIRDWKTGMPNSYLHRKLAEQWRGGPLETFMGSRQTAQGNIWEPQARAYFSALLEADIQEVGGMESDDGLLWCSPDGVIGETLGLEIKCPNADTHIGWLLYGQVPEEHVLQVQFGLFVTGWPAWQFLSFCKDFPHLAVVVEPDAGLAGTIENAVGEFQARFAAAWQALCERNGGPPQPRPVDVCTPDPIRFSWEQAGDPDDVIP